MKKYFQLYKFDLVKVKWHFDHFLSYNILGFQTVLGYLACVGSVQVMQGQTHKGKPHPTAELRWQPRTNDDGLENPVKFFTSLKFMCIKF